jgi:hypothetical protein
VVPDRSSGCRTTSSLNSQLLTALARDPVAVAVEPVRIVAYDAESALRNVDAVEVRRGWRDADADVAGVALDVGSVVGSE